MSVRYERLGSYTCYVLLAGCICSCQVPISITIHRCFISIENHSCQPSRNGWDSPGMLGLVPVASQLGQNTHDVLEFTLTLVLHSLICYNITFAPLPLGNRHANLHWKYYALLGYYLSLAIFIVCFIRELVSTEEQTASAMSSWNNSYILKP